MSPLVIERIDGVPIAHIHEDIDAANVTSTQQQLGEALGPDASSLKPHASCLMPHASCLMPHASCLMPHHRS
jgi:hypothetical protein